jgi:hypothetical protein
VRRHFLERQYAAGSRWFLATHAVRQQEEARSVGVVVQQRVGGLFLTGVCAVGRGYGPSRGDVAR